MILYFILEGIFIGAFLIGILCFTLSNKFYQKSAPKKPRAKNEKALKSYRKNYSLYVIGNWSNKIYEIFYNDWQKIIILVAIIILGLTIWITSLITNKKDDMMLAHAQYYSIILENGYIWDSQETVLELQKSVIKAKMDIENHPYKTFHRRDIVNQTYNLIMSIKMPAFENTKEYLLSSNPNLEKKEESVEKVITDGN